MRRLKATETAKVKMQLVDRQDWTCPLCGRSLRGVEAKNIVLDHHHGTGVVRGALCRNCNGMEGKVNTCATRAKGNLSTIQWLANLVRYLHKTQQAPPLIDGEPVLYSTYKTVDEKRLARNAKARARRKAKKEQGT